MFSVNSKLLLCIKSLEKHSFALLLAMATLTLLIGLAAAFYLGNTFKYYDEWDYHRIAVEVGTKGIYSVGNQNPTAFRPPGFVWIMAFISLLGGDTAGMRILNFLFLICNFFLVYFFLRKESTLAAALGVVLIAAYPVFLYTAGTLYPQTIAGTFLLASMWILFRTSLSPGYVFLLGLIYGYLILTVPTFAICPILTSAWWILRKEKESWTKCIAIWLIILIVMTPWTIRNYAAFGSFVPVSTNSGINFLLGNSANTQPNLGVGVDLSSYKPAPPYMNEAQANQYYTSLAMDYIKSHPVESLRMYGLKFLNYFNFWNVLATSTEQISIYEGLMLASYGFILLLAVFRLFMARLYPLEPFEKYAYLLYVGFGLLSAIYFTRIRFRLPCDYLLILINAHFIASWLKVRMGVRT